MYSGIRSLIGKYIEWDADYKPYAEASELLKFGVKVVEKHPRRAKKYKELYYETYLHQF